MEIRAFSSTCTAPVLKICGAKTSDAITEIRALSSTCTAPVLKICAPKVLQRHAVALKRS
jgi:hypothetical protein